MEKDMRGRWRRMMVAALVSLFIAPVSVFAAPNVPSGRSIIDSITARLCQLQQARGNRIKLVNPARCAPVPPDEERFGRLIVDKVTVPAGSGAVFGIMASGTGAIVGDGSGTTTDAVSKEYMVSAGTYSVEETTLPLGWIQTSNTCVDVVVGEGETKTCTITNIRLPKLTVTKIVVNDNDGTATTSDFALFVDGGAVTSGIQNIYATGTHMVSEGDHTGYTSTIGGDCASDGSITLAAGDIQSCTVTNDDIATTAGRLLITEVLADISNSTTTPQGTDPENEWVEVYNGTNAMIDLSDYTISDANTSDAIPDGTMLPSGKYLLIFATSTTASFWTIPGDAVIVVLSSNIGNGLANGGDMVSLKDGNGAEIDAVSWGTNTTAFTPSVTLPPDGNSITRTTPTTDTNTAADWVADPTPTPGS
ncbi:hypothetical protein COU18_00410 [Candidatus Kaiserbacteria bacterium CG10_big_fil_rev_8_21_14_0_10_51_14]|uniref:LTD domain-containing protein n=1 Tax=Candidatus Kaiserbacteria bacterium CG10_big_fil_rev_8_21_14_0_10_51_14 TaxID=1974610 RepID=A0A2H0UCQ3_9BACT|nr:MAG: hypothetical protein COU18_00410 [Candidatus Kaiserbacteria bacterium CG10_big_fil_rev_8_21_14_0_10_51_14]